MAPSTKEQLLLTAERLFALHGVDGVSLRQIGAEAGTTNNSAVQYYFGSKDGLIQAIFEYRLPQMLQRIRILTAQVHPGDLRAMVESYLLPFVELAETDDCHYLTFLEHLQRYSLEDHPFARLPASSQASYHEYVDRVGAMLPHLPDAVRSSRVIQASYICLHASADRERKRHYGTVSMAFVLYVTELFDGVIGFLQAPASERTLATLAATESAS